MTPIRIGIIGNKIGVLARPSKLVAGTVVTITFSFDSQWNTLIKKAVYKTNTTIITVPLKLLESQVVPWEVLVAGETLSVSLRGEDTNGNTIISTTFAKIGTIRKGVAANEDTLPTVPAQPGYQQLGNTWFTGSITSNSGIYRTYNTGYTGAKAHGAVELAYACSGARRVYVKKGHVVDRTQPVGTVSNPFDSMDEFIDLFNQGNTDIRCHILPSDDPGIEDTFDVHYSLFVAGALHITGKQNDKGKKYVLNFIDDQPYNFAAQEVATNSDGSAYTDKELKFYGGHWNLNNITIKAEGQVVGFETCVVALTNCTIIADKLMGFQCHWVVSNSNVPALVCSGCTGIFENLTVENSISNKVLDINTSNLTFEDNLRLENIFNSNGGDIIGISSQNSTLHFDTVDDTACISIDSDSGITIGVAASNSMIFMIEHYYNKLEEYVNDSRHSLKKAKSAYSSKKKRPNIWFVGNSDDIMLGSS